MAAPLPVVSRRLAAALVVLFALGVHARVVATGAWPEVRDEARLVDYGSYDAAVATTRAGADPYDPAMLLRHRRAPEPRVLSPYQYPPTFLVALGWTSSVTPAEAARVWFFVNEVGLLVGAAALVALAGDLATLVAAALVVAFLGAWPDHLRIGQANAVALAPLALGFLALGRGRDRLAGACVAVAGAVKLLPLLVVLPLLAARRWQAAVATLVASLALAAATIAGAPLAGFDVAATARATGRFWLEVVPALARGELAPPFPLDTFSNQSLASLVARHVGEGGLLAAGQRWVALALAGAATTLVLAAARRAAAPGSRPLAFAAVAVWPMLLAPSYVFEHHLVLALPALVFLAAEVARGRGAGHRAPWLAVSAIGLLGVAWSGGDLRARANDPGSLAEVLAWDLKTYAWVLCLACVGAAAARAGALRAAVRDPG